MGFSIPFRWNSDSSAAPPLRPYVGRMDRSPEFQAHLRERAETWAEWIFLRNVAGEKVGDDEMSAAFHILWNCQAPSPEPGVTWASLIRGMRIEVKPELEPSV